MTKVLIIGPKFHYFNGCIERAFLTLGYETRTLAYDNPVHPYNWVNKVRYKFSQDKLRLKRQSRALWQSEVNRAYEQYRPELVFMMNGDMLLPETIKAWRRQGTKVALWFFDSMTHIPLCEDNITAVDAVFCYEQTDIPIIRERYGVEAHFLPQAVDTQLYCPIAGAEKKYDIVFAGDLVHSRKRREVAQAIVAHYPNLRIRVWGEYKPWYKNIWTWLTRERRDVYTNCNASVAQLNADYNATRIVLNIHNEQQQDGANPKVYEIAATGVYQVCDANPYIEKLFAHQELGLYRLGAEGDVDHRFDELYRRIDEALSADKTKQAEAARQIVVTGHTFEQRVQQVLSTIYAEQSGESSINKSRDEK